MTERTIDEMCVVISEATAEINRLKRHHDALVAALRQLYEEQADYIRINNLAGCMDNKSMRDARAVLAALEADKP